MVKRHVLCGARRYRQGSIAYCRTQCSADPEAVRCGGASPALPVPSTPLPRPPVATGTASRTTSRTASCSAPCALPLSPLSDEEVSDLIKFADPRGTGIVTMSRFRSLPCWQTQGLLFTCARTTHSHPPPQPTIHPFATSTSLHPSLACACLTLPSHGLTPSHVTNSSFHLALPPQRWCELKRRCSRPIGRDSRRVERHVQQRGRRGPQVARAAGDARRRLE